MGHNDSTTLQPASDIDTIVAEFGDLPTLAPVALEVIRLADDDRASLEDVGRAISRDPSLAGRMLRLANSAMYAPAREVSSLERATAILGLRTVKLLSLGFSLIANIEADGPIDTGRIWRRSLVGSVIARSLADTTSPRLADEAFVAGLLSHVGKIALASEPAFHDVADAGRWPTPTDELARLGFSSDQLTARILVVWGLPRVLADAIDHRHRQADSDDLTAALAACLLVADDASALLTEECEQGRATAFDRLTMSAASRLGLTSGEIEDLIEAATPTIDEIARMFDLDSIGSTSVGEIMQSARDHLARLSLNIAAALTQEQQRADHLAIDNERLAEQAATDSLTGLPNRRTFDAYLANQVAGRARRSRDTGLALLVLDLDHFKSVNDNYGHGVGDEVLREVSTRIREATRRGELCARLGGEEFAVVLPDTDQEEVAATAERFRHLIGDEPVDTSIGPLTITVSIGGGHTRGESHDDIATGLLRCADTALYRAKAAGRDRVSMSSID